MILRSVSEDPVKMNKSFLFSLATSAEPMQVTWKMNDERDLICIRQMNESFTSRPCLRVNVSFICQPSLRVNLSFIVHRSSFIFHVTCIGSALVASRSMIRSSFIVHFSRDLHRLSTGTTWLAEGSFPTRPAFNESFLFPWLSLCKSQCVATRKLTNRSRMTHHYWPVRSEEHTSALQS